MGAMEAARPQILLGSLEPIMLVGLRRVLAEDGIDVIEGDSDELVTEARRLQPDAILLDLSAAGVHALGEELHRVAPQTKVILCARDETVMEVIEPASNGTRLVALTVPGGLRNELTSIRDRVRVED
jgi:DNA-binding NarL/FixJ family response regulator